MNMKEIATKITIHSKPDKVWQVLTDFERHRDWNPFIRSISGNKKVGEQLTVKIQPPESGAMTFKPLILSFAQNTEFRWRGKLFIKGVFDGEHYFILEDNTDGTTTLTQGEKFSGLLVGLLSNALGKTKSGFELMNEALKKECEKA